MFLYLSSQLTEFVTSRLVLYFITVVLEGRPYLDRSHQARTGSQEEGLLAGVGKRRGTEGGDDKEEGVRALGSLPFIWAMT